MSTARTVEIKHEEEEGTDAPEDSLIQVEVREQEQKIEEHVETASPPVKKKPRRRPRYRKKKQMKNRWKRKVPLYLIQALTPRVSHNRETRDSVASTPVAHSETKEDGQDLLNSSEST